MRVAVVGASGTLGRAVVQALRGRHEVLEVSRTRSVYHVDMASPASVRELYAQLGKLDAVVCAAGPARFAPLAELSEEDFRFSAEHKLLGQVQLVRVGINALRDGGSFTLTSGVLASRPTPGSAAVSMVNAALEGFTRAAALELPRGLRINCVSPGWVSETLRQMGQDPLQGIPAAEVARVYVASVERQQTGAILPADRA